MLRKVVILGLALTAVVSGLLWTTRARNTQV